MKRSFVFVMVLIVLGSNLFSCYKRPSIKTPNLETPKFPFTIMDERGSFIFVAPEYYSQKNLHDLFLWCYQKFLHEKGSGTVMVFTEKELLNAYLEVQTISRQNSDLPREYRKPLPPPPTSMGARRTSFDAELSIVPSESSLDMIKGDDIHSRGHNVTYSFAPDLSQPEVKKEVVLRGATWREGKYNLQAYEFPWQPGKIILTAYDIYNVEPSGRYYTFTIPRKIGDYKAKSIVFNILLDQAVSLNPNQVKIFSDKVAYVYLGWMYSVTLDGGKSWHLWDAEKNLPEWTCCDSKLIKDVTISEQGVGTMALRPHPRNPETLIYLRTDDFGQHWRKDAP